MTHRAFVVFGYLAFAIAVSGAPLSGLAPRYLIVGAWLLLVVGFAAAMQRRLVGYAVLGVFAVFLARGWFQLEYGV